jgi:hypothetical protein
VGEAEDGGGDEARPRQRQRDVEEAVPGPGAQRGGDLERAAADGLEGVGERLHDEGQRVDHRADHQAGEGERQQAEAERLGEPPERPVRPHRHQQVEADHGRRQHQRQRHHRADHALPARARARQPPRDRRADDEQQQARSVLSMVNSEKTDRAVYTGLW